MTELPEVADHPVRLETYEVGNRFPEYKGVFVSSFEEGDAWIDASFELERDTTYMRDTDTFSWEDYLKVACP